MADRDKRFGYSPQGRFQTPDTMRPWKSRYDMNSEELQNLSRQNVAAERTLTLALGTAQKPEKPLEVISSGRAFKIKGIIGSTRYNFTTNAGIETVQKDIMIACWINKIGTPSECLFLKNGDGFRGDFIKLYFFWPAQALRNARIYFYNFDAKPWADGSSST